MILLIPIEIAKEALDLGKGLGVSVIGYETSIVRRIMRSLRKEVENKRKTRDLCILVFHLISRFV